MNDENDLDVCVLCMEGYLFLLFTVVFYGCVKWSVDDSAVLGNHFMYGVFN